MSLPATEPPTGVRILHINVIGVFFQLYSEENSNFSTLILFHSFHLPVVISSVQVHSERFEPETLVHAIALETDCTVLRLNGE